MNQPLLVPKPDSSQPIALIVYCDDMLFGNMHRMESLRAELEQIGMFPVFIPPGATLANDQQIRPATMDVAIGHFQLQYGNCNPPRIWLATIDGKPLPPHTKLTIEIDGHKPPSVTVRFCPQIAPQREAADAT